MHDYLIDSFFQNYIILEFSEDDIRPILEDFIQECKNSKRRNFSIPYVNLNSALELSKADAQIVHKTCLAYTASIHFGNNELVKDFYNTQCIEDIIEDFASFIINPYIFNDTANLNKAKQTT